MSNNAAARVFAIVELLEKILEYLPREPYGEYSNPQLFVLQRVDRTFRNTIAGSPRLRKRMFELEPDMYRYWFHAEKKAIWISRLLCVLPKRNSKLMRAFRGEFLCRCRSDLAYDEGIKATAEKSTQGSWRRVKLVQDSVISPVLFHGPMVGEIGEFVDKFAFAEAGTTLGELLEGAWVNDARELLSKATRNGFYLAVEDWTK
ncbi:hypothetical protein HII31_02381 [Pseudocercospora fuligena]|uniref:F-box domain-containing protein n=1 Tax=Pseudocercospora fuligena TaxID=685502 RepID=A0A8H6RRS9_9PEZI|nr:hypothetical protein HII31_02381 [Pseudocercospora fuligena]